MVLTLESNSVQQAVAYGIDSFQRLILFWDALRERGNNYLVHNKAGKPTLLNFDYKIIADGRTLERPVNYALASIEGSDHQPPLPGKRPIVVIDPRAGHGPGIGGFKTDSEIGFALKSGHPVYFITFFPNPVPGQTITDIQQAEVRFIQQVSEMHPELPEPAVIGNCQAGWALALIGADRPDVTGPMVFVGSPLSYWAGAENLNPMRYRGGLSGGIWPVSFLSDLGNGKFDGANLVTGFEDLNPANTFWKKYYQLYADIDHGRDRFLNFERWWNGYFYMTGEEIHFIVKNLFVGNSLETGDLIMENGRRIDLKNIQDPVVILSSRGDNITPPQQALNWIAKTYGSVEEIRRNGQVIIYRVHEDIGHLGIFVSGRVARKEHRKIIETIDLTELLAPGLYEMVFKEEPVKAGIQDYSVRFEERSIDDILSLDDGQADEVAFHPVATISDAYDDIYRIFFQPLVRTMTTEWFARMTRLFHPLRMSRYMISDGNPFFTPVKSVAPLVKANRQPVDDDNMFKVFEKCAAGITAGVFDYYRDTRDATAELIFRLTYDNPLMTFLFTDRRGSERQSPEKQIEPVAPTPQAKKRLSSAMTTGGFANAIVRIMVAVAGADRVLHQVELAEYFRILKANRRLRWINRKRLREMIKRQSAFIDMDHTQAIQTLTTLLPTPEDRREAVEIAEKIAVADRSINDEEKSVLIEIKKTLRLSEDHDNDSRD